MQELYGRANRFASLSLYPSFSLRLFCVSAVFLSVTAHSCNLCISYVWKADAESGYDVSECAVAMVLQLQTLARARDLLKI